MALTGVPAHRRPPSSVLEGIVSTATGCVETDRDEDSRAPGENTSDPADVLEVRAAIDDFNDSVGEVDVDGIYERLPEEADVGWAQYKPLVY